MSGVTFTTLSKKAKKVVKSLNWEIYHTPENLTLFLVGEAAELGEFCQWTSKEGLRRSPVLKVVKEEIADVVKSVLYLSNALTMPISLEALLAAKLKLDNKMYNIKDYKGIHRYMIKKIERRKEGIPQVPRNKKNMKLPVTKLQKMAWKFIADRDWQQFYSPASLALAICVKSGEVATCYQRRPMPVEDPYTRLLWALCDILLNALRLSEYLGFKDLAQLVLRKLNGDQRRFKKIEAIWAKIHSMGRKKTMPPKYVKTIHKQIQKAKDIRLHCVSTGQE